MAGVGSSLKPIVKGIVNDYVLTLVPDIVSGLSETVNDDVIAPAIADVKKLLPGGGCRPNVAQYPPKSTTVAAASVASSIDGISFVAAPMDTTTAKMLMSYVNDERTHDAVNGMLKAVRTPGSNHHP